MVDLPCFGLRFGDFASTITGSSSSSLEMTSGLHHISDIFKEQIHIKLPFNGLGSTAILALDRLAHVIIVTNNPGEQSGTDESNTSERVQNITYFLCIFEVAVCFRGVGVESVSSSSSKDFAGTRLEGLGSV